MEMVYVEKDVEGERGGKIMSAISKNVAQTYSSNLERFNTFGLDLTAFLFLVPRFQHQMTIPCFKNLRIY